MKTCVVVLLIFAVATLFFISYKKVKKYTQPKSYRKDKVYTDYFIENLPRQDIYLKTKDDINIKGWIFKNSKEKTVVLVHGIAENRSFLNRLVPFYHQMGFTVLSIDLRNHGESQKTKTTLGYLERLDVLAAVEFLRKQGYKKIIVHGVSMGAVASALAKGQSPESIDLLILDSPYLSLKESTEYTYRNLPEPMLKILSFLSLKLGQLFTGINADDLEIRDEILKFKDHTLVIFCEIDRYLDTKKAYKQLKEKGVSVFFFENTEHALAFVWYPDTYKEVIRNFLRRLD